VFLSEPLANEVVGVVETDDGDTEVYFGPMMLGLIDGVSLKLRRLNPACSSTVRREGQPSSRSSPSNSENVVTDHAGLNCYRSSRSLITIGRVDYHFDAVARQHFQCTSESRL
jgi:hypothetical protein